jgi:hypothetical protein
MNMTRQPTIYSISYSKRQPAELKAIAEGLNAVILDVRGLPASRRPGFGRAHLEKLLGRRYRWVGDSLGNRPDKGITVKQSGIRALLKATEPGILMCQCPIPALCHRHIFIARPLLSLGLDVRHIYNDVIIRASDLEKGINSGSDDLLYDDLAEIMSRGGYDGPQVEPAEPDEPPTQARPYKSKRPAKVKNEPTSEVESDTEKSSRSDDSNVIAKRRIEPQYLL